MEADGPWGPPPPSASSLTLSHLFHCMESQTIVQSHDSKLSAQWQGPKPVAMCA